MVGGYAEQHRKMENKTLVLGMLECGGELVTRIVPDQKRASLAAHCRACPVSQPDTLWMCGSSREKKPTVLACPVSLRLWSHKGLLWRDGCQARARRRRKSECNLYPSTVLSHGPPSRDKLGEDFRRSYAKIVSFNVPFMF